MAGLAVTVVTLLATLCALASLAVGQGVAYAETPAERCERETNAYNNAWKQGWAASNPGKSPNDAPPPPVPYVCRDPQATPENTPTTPSVVAPSLPGATTPTTPGTGPNMTAHAPTDIPPPGRTPIVPVPETRTVQPPVSNTAVPTAPTASLGDAVESLRRNADNSGLPPYRACGSSAERKTIGEYDVAGDRRAFMVCGNREYGFEHIKGRHMDDWANKAMITGDKWMDLMDYTIEATLRHPEATSQRDGKTCYARKIWMYDKRNGEVTGKFFWSHVIVKDSNGDIITAYPTGSGDHRCTS
ncbi:hypothetical protein KTR9_5437 (plasmid) [Gordonia sp. KTR9]|uniref:Bacterial EndoU nuclease domain-containing protein n=2 Tax=Gordoniaceae TaxID=85026 RepID=A0A243Q5G1_9ACTN|nr:hypothetical protein KTR9_5437 [Gordonia sp. KTR9]OUC76662.1 hypothetical protein CA982_20670 [Gordonia lacunae]